MGRTRRKQSRIESDSDEQEDGKKGEDGRQRGETEERTADEEDGQESGREAEKKGRRHQEVQVKKVPGRKRGRKPAAAKDGGVSLKKNTNAPPNKTISKELWRLYTGTKWRNPDQIEYESEDDSDYEPMMPLNPDKPDEVDCVVAELEDDETNGLDRGLEVESVIGVGVDPLPGEQRQCFVKFVGIKRPQMIPMDVVKEKALQCWLQWNQWQHTQDNLDKCGAYWLTLLRQPPSWMCRRSLAAFAEWKRAKGCGEHWKWAPKEEAEYDEEDEDEEDDDDEDEQDDDAETASSTGGNAYASPPSS